MRAAALLVLLATAAAVRPSLRRASEIATTLEELSNEVDELSVEMEAHALVPEPLALERRERTERTTVQAPVGREARVVKLKARAGKYWVNNVIRYRYLAVTARAFQIGVAAMWVAITIAKGSLVFMGIQATAVAWMGGFLTAAAGPIGIAILIIIGIGITYYKRWERNTQREVEHRLDCYNKIPQEVLELNSQLSQDVRSARTAAGYFTKLAKELDDTAANYFAELREVLVDAAGKTLFDIDSVAMMAGLEAMNTEETVAKDSTGEALETEVKLTKLQAASAKITGTSEGSTKEKELRRKQDEDIGAGKPLDPGTLVNGRQLQLSLQNDHWETVAAQEAVVDDKHRSPHEKAVLGFFRVLDEIQNPDGGWYGWLPSPTVIAHDAKKSDGANDALEEQKRLAGTRVVDTRRKNTAWSNQEHDVEKNPVLTALRLTEVTAECSMVVTGLTVEEDGVAEEEEFFNHGGLALFLCQAKKLVEATANEGNPVTGNAKFKTHAVDEDPSMLTSIRHIPSFMKQWEQLTKMGATVLRMINLAAANVEADDTIETSRNKKPSIVLKDYKAPQSTLDADEYEKVCFEYELNDLNLAYLKALTAELIQGEDAEGVKQDGAVMLNGRIVSQITYMQEQFDDAITLLEAAKKHKGLKRTKVARVIPDLERRDGVEEPRLCKLVNGLIKYTYAHAGKQIARQLAAAYHDIGKSVEGPLPGRAGRSAFGPKRTDEPDHQKVKELGDMGLYVTDMAKELKDVTMDQDNVQSSKLGTALAAIDIVLFVTTIFLAGTDVREMISEANWWGNMWEGIAGGGDGAVWMGTVDTNKEVLDATANFVKFLEVVSLSWDAFDGMSEAYTTIFGESLALGGYMFEEQNTQEDKTIAAANKGKALEAIALYCCSEFQDEELSAPFGPASNRKEEEKVCSRVKNEEEERLKKKQEEEGDRVDQRDDRVKLIFQKWLVFMWWPKNGHTCDTAAEIFKELAGQGIKDQVRTIKESLGSTGSNPAVNQLNGDHQNKLKKLTKIACEAAMTTARGWSESPSAEAYTMATMEVNEFLSAANGAWWRASNVADDMKTKISIMESTCAPSWLEPGQREMCRMWLLSMMKNNKCVADHTRDGHCGDKRKRGGNNIQCGQLVRDPNPYGIRSTGDVTDPCVYRHGCNEALLKMADNSIHGCCSVVTWGATLNVPNRVFEMTNPVSSQVHITDLIQASHIGVGSAQKNDKFKDESSVPVDFPSDEELEKMSISELRQQRLLFEKVCDFTKTPRVKHKSATSTDVELQDECTDTELANDPTCLDRCTTTVAELISKGPITKNCKLKEWGSAGKASDESKGVFFWDSIRKGDTNYRFDKSSLCSVNFDLVDVLADFSVRQSESKIKKACGWHEADPKTETDGVETDSLKKLFEGGFEGVVTNAWDAMGDHWDRTEDVLAGSRLLKALKLFFGHLSAASKSNKDIRAVIEADPPIIHPGLYSDSPDQELEGAITTVESAIPVGDPVEGLVEARYARRDAKKAYIKARTARYDKTASDQAHKDAKAAYYPIKDTYIQKKKDYADKRKAMELQHKERFKEVAKAVATKIRLKEVWKCHTDIKMHERYPKDKAVGVFQELANALNTKWDGVEKELAEEGAEALVSWTSAILDEAKAGIETWKLAHSPDGPVRSLADSFDVEAKAGEKQAVLHGRSVWKHWADEGTDDLKIEPGEEGLAVGDNFRNLLATVLQSAQKLDRTALEQGKDVWVKRLLLYRKDSPTVLYQTSTLPPFDDRARGLSDIWAAATNGFFEVLLGADGESCTDLLTAQQWYLGADGESCNEVCEHLTGVTSTSSLNVVSSAITGKYECDAKALHGGVYDEATDTTAKTEMTEEAMVGLFKGVGVSCTAKAEADEDKKDSAPYVDNTENSKCYRRKGTSPSKCDSKPPDSSKRLCPCTPKSEEQRRRYFLKGSGDADTYQLKLNTKYEIAIELNKPVLSMNVQTNTLYATVNLRFNNEPRVTSRGNLQSRYAPLLHAKREWSLAKKAYKLVAQKIEDRDLPLEDRRWKKFQKALKAKREEHAAETVWMKQFALQRWQPAVMFPDEIENQDVVTVGTE